MRIFKYLILVVLCVACALAADSSLVGRWSVSAKTQDGNQTKVTLEFKQEGSNISGRVITDNGDVAPIESVVLEGDQFKCKVPVDEGSYTISGTVKGNEITGTYRDPRGTSGSFTAKRS